MEALELNVPSWDLLASCCMALHPVWVTPAANPCPGRAAQNSTKAFPKIKQTHLFLRKLVHVHLWESRFLLRNKMWRKLDMSLLLGWKRIMITAYCWFDSEIQYCHHHNHISVTSGDPIWSIIKLERKITGYLNCYFSVHVGEKSKLSLSRVCSVKVSDIIFSFSSPKTEEWCPLWQPHKPH